MSITDELREYATVRWEPWAEARDRLLNMCDSIDAEHQKACNDAWDNGYEADYLGIEKWLTEHPQVMEHHGWVPLPVDADGVPIHIGDVMENIVCPPVHREVTGVGVECFYGWDDGNGRYSQFDANCYRHHHAPTVEDVLREFAQEMNENLGMYTGEAIDADEWRKADERTIAEYAARLRLAGEE